MNKIAVIVNSEGITSSIMEMSLVKTYEKKNNSWKVIDEVPYTIDLTTGLALVRRSIGEMILKLADCKALVATEVSGQLYYILEANGFNSYEAVGEPLLYLDSILESETSEPTSIEDKDILEAAVSILPKSTEECGVFSINLKKALALNPMLSSKKILRPILLEKNFDVLEVYCDHEPKWFETDLKGLGLSSTVTKTADNEYKITILVIH